MDDLNISHLVAKGFSIGDPVQGLCGKIFRAKVEDPDRVVCGPCSMELLALAKNLEVEADELRAVVDDLERRMDLVKDALMSKDKLKQEVWLHAVADDMLCDAFFGIGPARLQGPKLENGTYFSE